MPSGSDPAMAPSFAVRPATPKDAAQVDAVLSASFPKLMQQAAVKGPSICFAFFGLDVRTLTFCQLVGFPLNH